MMTNEEASACIRELRFLLRGYPWVAENVDAIIELGTAVKDNSQEEDRVVLSQPGSVRAYSEVEKLTLFVDEIDASILQPAVIAERLPTFFRFEGVEINEFLQRYEDGFLDDFEHGPFRLQNDDPTTLPFERALFELEQALIEVRRRIEQ